MPKNIIAGQRVSQEKASRAKRLRKNMTPEETLLWRHLRANRLGGYHFRRQQVIDGFIVDFYCHASALVIEIDGSVHESREIHDNQRDRILTERGVRIVRIKNEEVRNEMEKVLQKILRLCSKG